MKESSLVKSIIQYLVTRRDVFAWRNNTGAIASDGRFLRYGKKGSADIIGVFNGRFIGIEAKVGKNTQSYRNTFFKSVSSPQVVCIYWRTHWMM